MGYHDPAGGPKCTRLVLTVSTVLFGLPTALLLILLTLIVAMQRGTLGPYITTRDYVSLTSSPKGKF